MAKRKTEKVVAITEADYQDALAGYAKCDALAEKTVAEMNVHVTKIREKYDPTLTELLAQRDAFFEVVQKYCVANKAVLFEKARSVETTHGRVGFRLGTPKLKTLPKWTWDKVLEQLKVVLPGYVRTKQEPDKESLLADRELADVAKHLNDVGVYVGQEESFYVELKKEEVTEG